MTVKSTDKLRVNEQRLWQSHMEMGRIGALPNGGCCRLALSAEDHEGRKLFIRWSREAGCEVTVDHAGNIFCRRPGRDNSLPPVATGSHLDTQPHAGLFDGIYGVLAGLEIFRTLNDNGITTEAPLETIVWTNEECVRFEPPTSGSLAFAGLIDINDLHVQRTTDGTSVKEDLERWGYLGQALDAGTHPLACFFEAHIEQGPVLEDRNVTIGVVSGIQGARMFGVDVKGQDSHAGTTPMPLRRDALTCATDMLRMLNRLVPPEDMLLRLTVGRFDVRPNAPSTVPGEVRFEIDLRHPETAMLNRIEEQMREQLRSIAETAGLEMTLREICAVTPVFFDEGIQQLLRENAENLGYSYLSLVSGAGHDAGNLVAVAPTAMIFVPCEKGISHNEAENAAPSDLAAGANVLMHSMLARAHR